MGNNKNSLSISRLVLNLLISLSLMNLGVIFFLPDSEYKVILSDILFILLNFMTVICLWLAARHSKNISGKYAKSWVILCLAQLLFAFGDLSWAYYEIIIKSAPFPSVADIFYLAYYPVFLIGILLLSHKIESKIKRINNWLDTGIIFISAGLGLGVYLLTPLLDSVAGETLFVQILTIAYPLGDLILLSALLILIYNHPNEKLEYPIIFIAISISIQIVTDIAFSYQSLMGTYVSGGWLDSGWILGYLTLGIAGYLQSSLRETTKRETSNLKSKIIVRNQIITTLRSLLPYLLVLLTYFLLFENYKNKTYVQMNLLFGGVGILVVLVLTRQFLSLSENNHLNINLENAIKKVRSQSFIVQEINDTLRHEIGVRKKAEIRLAFNALHDSLTKLPNRVLFTDRLKHAIDYSKRHAEYIFSVFFIDLDYFKNVNDSVGHAVGDELLVYFTERVQKCLRKSDTLARLGGDEFAILLENNSTKKTSIVIAKRIQESLRPPYILAGTNFYISASTGIVLNTKKYDNPVDILQDADFAMYQAKVLGRSRFVLFTSVLRTQAISRLELESQLRNAIDKHEFILNYQPIYSLAKKSLVGFEALLRWNHPERGVLLPVDFLSVAEDSEIIEQIGEWVIFQACLQMKQWHEKYPQYQNLVININISGRQFRNPDFINLLNTVINDTGLKPDQIHLEITETVLIENQSRANNIFKSLQKMGFQIQIDDFGIGYSSLGYLQRFPVDTIKIDKSFIQSMGKEEKGSQLVNAMITMAHHLGMEVIAEGIETGKQLHDLKSMSCNYGQGYYLSHPLPSPEIDLLIQSEQHK